MPDKNNNQHYKDCLIEPFYLMADLLNVEEFIGFLKGNLIKYAMRAPFKGESEKDIEKYKYYSSLLQYVLTLKKSVEANTNSTIALKDTLDEFKFERGEC